LVGQAKEAIPDSKFQIPDSRFQIPEFKTDSRKFKFQVSEILVSNFRNSSFRFQDPDFKF
jgi:hypothetical protein